MPTSFKKKGKMSSHDKHLFFLAMQVLEEENRMDVAHVLAQETGIYLNMKYLEREVMKGNWEEVEKYLCRFTEYDDNFYSRKIFWNIREVKYLEALEKHDWENAVDILSKELSVFASTNDYSYEKPTQLTPDNIRHDLGNAVELLSKKLSDFAFTNDYLYEQPTQLTPDNFRENNMFAKYKDKKSTRTALFVELKKLIEANPMLCDKLQRPTLNTSEFRMKLQARYGDTKLQGPSPKF